MAFTLSLNANDATAAIRYGSLVIRLNTCDFALIDPTGLIVPVLGEAVIINALSWSGNIVSIERRDLVDVRSGHAVWICSASNSASPLPRAGGASQTLSDQPTTVTDTILLEDGSGGISLEDGTLTASGLIEMEGALAGYQGLSVRTQTNQLLTASALTFFGSSSSTGQQIPASTSTLGQLTTFQGGLWPGIQFSLYSNNLGYAGTLFTVTETMITWPAGQPVYTISFGSSALASDAPWTLQTWTQALIHG